VPDATPTAGLALARLLWPPTPSTLGALLVGNASVSALMLLSLVLKHVFLGNLSVIEAQNATEKAISWLLLKVVQLQKLRFRPRLLKSLKFLLLQQQLRFRSRLLKSLRFLPLCLRSLPFQ
jgi:hypothetical protein